ncbi:MAG: DUF4835 family protein [Chitinophagales bacterium]|jgi:hypothetical protein|nr:DUF4835 family protein [Chitinophagales bacterium]
MKELILFYMLALSHLSLSAQELQADVQINLTTNTTSINPQIFTTLQQTIATFLNNRKWTNEEFPNNHKIKCSFIFNLKDASQQDVYVFDLSVVAERPVYNATYSSPFFRHLDQGISVKYMINDPLDYNENLYVNNLSANLAFYSHLIIGLYLESFGKGGGQSQFDQAVTICNLVPNNANEGGKPVLGFSAAEAMKLNGDRSKIGMSLDLQSTKFSTFREIFYQYHLEGLDMLADEPAEGKKKILAILQKLKEIQGLYRSYIISQFALAKAVEIIDIYSSSPKSQLEEAKSALVAIEPTTQQTIMLKSKN